MTRYIRYLWILTLMLTAYQAAASTAQNVEKISQKEFRGSFSETYLLLNQIGLNVIEEDVSYLTETIAVDMDKVDFVATSDPMAQHPLTYIKGSDLVFIYTEILESGEEVHAQHHVDLNDYGLSDLKTYYLGYDISNDPNLVLTQCDPQSPDIGSCLSWRIRLMETQDGVTDIIEKRVVFGGTRPMTHIDFTH